jgi:hypothetical protein
VILLISGIPILLGSHTRNAQWYLQLDGDECPAQMLNQLSAMCHSLSMFLNRPMFYHAVEDLSLGIEVVEKPQYCRMRILVSCLYAYSKPHVFHSRQ